MDINCCLHKCLASVLLRGFKAELLFSNAQSETKSQLPSADGPSVEALGEVTTTFEMGVGSLFLYSLV